MRAIPDTPTRAQSTATVRPSAHCRSVAIFSAISTDNGRVTHVRRDILQKLERTQFLVRFDHQDQRVRTQQQRYFVIFHRQGSLLVCSESSINRRIFKTHRLSRRARRTPRNIGLSPGSVSIDGASIDTDPRGNQAISTPNCCADSTNPSHSESAKPRGMNSS